MTTPTTPPPGPPPGAPTGPQVIDSPVEPVVSTDPASDPTSDTNPSPSNMPATDSTDPASGNDQFSQELAQILAGTFGATKAPTDPEVRSAAALYLKLWGVAPPPGYIEGLVKSGLNLYEIASNEMAKPAFRFTRSYRDQFSGYAGQIAQLFGRR